MATPIKVGNIEIVSLLDVGHWHLPGFFPSAPADLWATYRGIYPEALCDGDAICTSATAYAVRANGRTILVDAGLGPGPHPRAGNQRGQLLEDMKAAGISPDEIDTVIATHLHLDHVGWNATDTGAGVVPTFPKARYLLPEKDWAYYTRPEMADRIGYLQGTIRLFEQGRVELVSGEVTVTPDIRLVPTPGHTPGHQAVFLASAGERAAIIGDAAHTPAQVQETTWAPSADVDPVMSGETRRTLFDQVERDHTLLCAGHFPHPGFGYLTRLEGRRIYQAV